MNRNDLITVIAKETGVSKKDVTAVTNSLFDRIAAAMATGDKVQLIGFGTFEAKERAARIGKNPRTGEEVNIAACKVPSFKAGKGLKDAVNK